MVQIFNSRGQLVGNYDMKTCTYHSERDHLKGQIYNKPAFANAMAIDVEIYDKLLAMGCKIIHILVRHFEKESFIAELTMKEFKEKAEITDYDRRSKSIENYYGEPLNLTRYGKQYKVKMNDWRRVYFGQKTLEVIR